MLQFDLEFESKEASLSVRRIVISEAISAPFKVTVFARSPREDLDFEAIVGKKASLTVRAAGGMSVGGISVGGDAWRAALTDGSRQWTGLVTQMEHVETAGSLALSLGNANADKLKDSAMSLLGMNDSSSLALYRLELMPTLWLLGQRLNHRVFQHLSVPDIVDVLLGEWQVEHEWKIDRAAFPKLEMRIQYGETDLAFATRLLEEAGISYFFVDDPKKGSVVVFTDAPERAELRPEAKLTASSPFAQAIDNTRRVSNLRLTRIMRTGKVTLRDHDFRRKLDYKLMASSPPLTPEGPESPLEHFEYRPGTSLIETGGAAQDPVADDQSVARYDDKDLQTDATRDLEGRRGPQYELQFDSNTIDLRPGTVMMVMDHASAHITGKPLLVTESSLSGDHDGELTSTGAGILADKPYRPRLKTPRPRLEGVQSAVVVGPEKEEIYTDEFGRVRVQFAWDRDGKYNEKTSAWVRVAHDWAGTGYGTMDIPRVGHEVLISFLEGNPDLPVIMGCLYNTLAPVPYKLPDNKSRSVWRTNTYPGGGGANEIYFEDAKGKEVVSVLAERDMHELIKHDRSVVVGRNDTAVIGQLFKSGIDKSATGMEMVAGRITLSTGEATIELNGANVLIFANALNEVHSSGADVTVIGSPDVLLNCSAAAATPKKQGVGGSGGGGGQPAPAKKTAQPAPKPAAEKKAAPAPAKEAPAASGDAEARKKKLKDTADQARANNPKHCNESTAEVANAMGHPELNGKLANQQVDYMDKNWEAVDAKTAQERANNGDLVVAGLSDNPHGHTSIVVPGDGAVKPDGRFYPNVEGGAMNKWARDHGTGDYTAGDVWSTTDRKNVKYYVPK